jgi:hypothetical protein
MADYYPVIARAVSNLSTNTGEARRALYERARTILVWQLTGHAPPVTKSDILSARAALEAAIRRVDAEWSSPNSAPQSKATTRKEALEAFLRLPPDGRTIGISANAVRELYGDEIPSPDDGKLGWVPDLEAQLRAAEEIGGDIDVPLSGWLAKTKPEAQDALHDFVRVRPPHPTSVHGVHIFGAFLDKDQVPADNHPGRTNRAPPVAPTPPARKSPTDLQASADPKKPVRPSIWPLLVAPVVALFYYWALKSALGLAILNVFGKLIATDADLSDLAKAPQWGSHWVYRLCAEFTSIWFATFITAGLARGRERSAAIIRGLTISLVFLASVAFQLGDWASLDAEDYSAEWPEPWYQSAITALMIFIPLFVARYVSEAAKETNLKEPLGFAGINPHSSPHFLK